MIGQQQRLIDVENPIAHVRRPFVMQGKRLAEAMANSAGRKPYAEALSAALAEAAAAGSDSDKLELIDLEAIAGPRHAG